MQRFGVASCFFAGSFENSYVIIRIMTAGSKTISGHFSKAVFLFMAFVLNIVCITNPIFAYKKLTEDETLFETYAQNDIYFYDPYECLDPDGYTSKPTGDQITWIGDSYSVGAESKIEAKLPGVDLDGVGTPRNIQGSKRFGYDITGTNADSNYKNHNISSDNPSGLTILKNLSDKNKLRKYVVFALGTNDQGIDSEPLVKEMIDIGGSDRTYILMTPRTYDYTYKSIIDGFKSASKKYDNIIIADWEAAVTEDLEKYFSPKVDKIHPNSEGYDLFVQTIYDALPGGSVGILEGKDNAEKIWNYFATANIAGVSDNVAVISAFIGNFYAESGLDPFVSSSCLGLFQICDSSGQKDEFLQYLSQNGISYYSAGSTEDEIAKGIKVEMDFLVEKYHGFDDFVSHLDVVSNNTPESYSELFVAIVERAVCYPGMIAAGVECHTFSQPLNDSGVMNYVLNEMYPSGIYHTVDSYQGVETRRQYAREIFDKYAGTSASNSLASQTTSSSGSNTFTWKDGWLVDGMPGLTKEDVSNNADLDETIIPGYATDDNKPHVIILHSTEGTGNGYSAYPSGNKYPAHFIIDLKKKEAYQNLPITDRALAVVNADGYGVQIEIVGFSTEGYRPDPSYYLQDFTAEEWDYLAVLLGAIAQETGIPLTSSVKWDSASSNKNRISSMDEFKNIEGVVGHMHIPGNDHIDPGDIWQYIEAAIARNPDASKFANGNTSGYCPKDDDGSSSSGLKSGGMTLEEAIEFMKAYREEASKQEFGTMHFQGALVYDSSQYGTLNNCSAFTQWFLNRYTTAGPDGATLYQGSRAVSLYLSDFPDLEDGGKVPKAYAVMSMGPFSDCADGWCNHTGIVLGVDQANDKIIIGEASWTNGYTEDGFKWPYAHEYSLSDYTNSSSAYGPTYAYTDKMLKGL